MQQLSRCNYEALRLCGEFRDFPFQVPTAGRGAFGDSELLSANLRPLPDFIRGESVFAPRAEAPSADRLFTDIVPGLLPSPVNS